MHTMNTKVLDLLDALYVRSLDADPTAADRQFVSRAMEKVIAKCDDFLVNGVQITNEQRAKFRKLRNLCADECRMAELGYDILTHWTLTRDLLVSIDSTFAPAPEKTI